MSKKTGRTVNLEDLKEAGTTGAEVMQMAEKAAEARGHKKPSEFETMMERLEKLASSHNDRAKLEATIQDILDKCPDPDAAMLAALQEAQDLLNKVNGKSKSKSDISAIAEKAKFLSKLRVLNGADLDWRAVAALVLDRDAKDALSETKIREDAIVVKSFDEKPVEKFFTEASADVIDNNIGIQLRRIYNERREAARAQYQASRQAADAKEKELRANATLTHDQFRNGRSGTLLVVVYDKEERRKMGAFAVESNGTTIKVVDTTSPAVWDLLNNQELFGEFRLDPEKAPRLLVNLIRKDRERLEAVAKAREEERAARRAEAKKHMEDLQAKATISLAEGNSGKDGALYVPIRYIAEKGDRPIFGGFLVEVKAGRARVIETAGEGGRLISDEEMRKSLSWEQFCNNFVGVIRRSLRNQANKEEIMLPGMKPQEAKKEKTKEVSDGEKPQEATEVVSEEAPKTATE